MDSPKSVKRHVIRRLYDAEFDFNCFGRDPIGTYMLATLPRSGSTFCAIRLWQTGLLGAPMEYLNFRIMGDLFQRLGYRPGEDGLIEATKVSAYWRDVQRLRTSSNGVFGYKMFTSNYTEVAKKFPDFLPSITPNYVIYLTREDAIGQAMSYSRAQRSRVWFAGAGQNPAVEYDYEHIKICLRSIEQQKAAWESVFQLTGVKPHRISYENLMTSGDQVIAGVLRAMGMSPDASSALEIPMIMRQTDGISRSWRERFQEDSAIERSRQSVEA
jgi:LPS sulfotransferase NodH